MNDNNCSRYSIRCWLDNFRDRLDNLLAVASMLAVALVVSGELVNASYQVPFLNTSWSEVQVVARTIIWLVFITHFTLYTVFAKERMNWVRHHLLELIVCVTWVPHYSHGFFASTIAMLSLSRVVPLDVMQLTGTLAHAWRVLRWTAQRFSAHPLFVTSAAALLLITSAGAVENHIEPQTFPTFWDGFWYALSTVSTIGYGDIVPHTFPGRVVGAVLIVCGVTIFALFLGLASEFARKALLDKHQKKQLEEKLDLHNDLARNNELLEKILAELSSNSTLQRQFMERLEKVEKKHEGDEDKGS